MRRRLFLPQAAILGAVLVGAAGAASARASGSVDEFVRRFESSYRHVRTLRADFTQTFYAWGESRTESGTVEFARRGRMRWDYRQPEEKVFVSNGKETFLYVPQEKQVTRSPARASDDARVPLRLLLSHLDLHKVFAKIEFANQALRADPGDLVLRAYPQGAASQEYRSVLVEVTPSFDVRRLVIFYPDNSTMQFEFTHIQRNAPVADSSFEFTPPAGTRVVEQ